MQRRRYGKNTSLRWTVGEQPLCVSLFSAGKGDNKSRVLVFLRKDSLNKIIGRNLFNHWLILISKLILVMIKLMIIMFLILTRHHEISFFHMFASNTIHTLLTIMNNIEVNGGSVEISLLILNIINPFISIVCRK